LEQRCDRAVKLNEEGRRQDARKHLRKTLSYYPTSIRARHLAWYMELPEVEVPGTLNGEAAATRYRAIVQKSPDNPLAHLRLAATVVSEGSRSATREAADIAQRAVGLAAEDPGVLTRAAAICRFDDFELARQFVGRARTAVSEIEDPGQFESVFGSTLKKLEGIILFRDGSREEGLALIEKSHEREPDDVDTATVFAAHLEIVEEPRRALDVIDRTLSLRRSENLLALRTRIAARMEDAEP